MAAYKKPIQKSLSIGYIIFILLLSFVLTLASYLTYSTALYKKYDEKLKNITNYVAQQIDTEDLKKCIATQVPSEKYKELQQLLNGMVDTFELEYLYIISPAESKIALVNICSATSAEERANGEEDMAIGYSESEYSRESYSYYNVAWTKDDISFFDDASDKYGTCHTGALPLKDADGKTFALICADLAVGDLHKSVNKYVAVSTILTLIICGIFVFAMRGWLRRNVIDPVVLLEQSARDFADRIKGERDPNKLVFNVPEIYLHNEVQSLADAISMMSGEIKTDVNEIIATMQRAETAEKEAENMTSIAYNDVLTNVKTKAAYKNKCAELDEAIRQHRAEFALVMVDINNLKHVNDTYGHEAGDKYIIGSCHTMCDVFKRSPVYRVGGDEFVIVVEGSDFVNRATLYHKLRETFAATETDFSLEPWERYSAAAGMAVCTGSDSDSAEEVLKRADAKMYANKAQIKAELKAIEEKQSNNI